MSRRIQYFTASYQLGATVGGGFADACENSKKARRKGTDWKRQVSNLKNFRIK